MATIADELNAISVEHGYTGAAPKTIAGAIDALADTLAGTDVEGKRTIAGAVKALAPYIGGGGTTLGPLVGGWNPVNIDRSIICFGFEAPTVGSDAFYGNPALFTSISIGSQVVAGDASGDSGSPIEPPIAAGLTVTILISPRPTLYRGTFTNQQGQDGYIPVCESFAEFTDYTYDEETGVLTFTVPELASNEFLSIYSS